MMGTFFEEEAINYAFVSESVSKLLEAMAIQFHQQLSSGESSIQYIVSEYDSHTVPDIQLCDYLYRIVSLSKCANRDVISALVYIDRLINNGIISGISFHNVHRLLGVTIMISAKLNEDQPYSNKSWSKILGIPLRELNVVEINFLTTIDFNLRIDLNDLNTWINSILIFATTPPIQNSGNATENIEDQNSSELTEEAAQQAEVVIDL
jgi:hypothetical protein